MNCPECHFDNPDSHRFCGMCGALVVARPSAETTAPVPESPAPRAAEEPATQESKTDNGRRPFIVQSTAHDTTSQVTRVAVTPTMGSSTHSNYPPVTLRSEVEDVYHGDYLPQPIVAPVDPEDEPLFSGETIHVVKTPEEREREEWARLAEAEREDSLPSVSAPVAGSVLGLTAPIAERREEIHEEPSEPVWNPYHEPQVSAPVSGSMLGLTAPIAESSHPSGLYAEEPAEPEPLSNPLHEPVQTEARSGSYLQFGNEEQERTTDVSGPSFLGLGAPDQDYLYEEPRSSHARRNLLLLVLVVFAVLGVLEWRASTNGESTNPIDVLHIKLPKKKGQGEAVVVPPGTNAPGSQASGNDTTAANNGKPDLIAEPNHPAAQPANPPADNAAATKTDSQPASPSTTASNASAPAPAANPPVTGLNDGVPSKAPMTKSAANAKTAETPTDTTSPSAATPPDNPPPQTPVPAKSSSAKAPAIAKPAPAASKPVETAALSKKPAKPAAKDEAAANTGGDASLAAGAFELHKGIAAGPTAEGRTWLWRAMSKGNGQAPVLLADMYAQGKGVTKDCEQAVLLLKAASKKPNPAARAKLGSMYATGQCLPKDRVEAYRWTHAALQANPGSEWLEKNQESLLQEMTAAERRRASIIK